MKTAKRKVKVPARSVIKVKTFKPATMHDVAEDNPRMIVNQLRAVQRDMKAGFDRMDVRFETLLKRALTIIDDIAHRMTSLEQRVTALEAKPHG